MASDPMVAEFHCWHRVQGFFDSDCDMGKLSVDKCASLGYILRCPYNKLKNFAIFEINIFHETSDVSDGLRNISSIMNRLSVSIGDLLDSKQVDWSFLADLERGFTVTGQFAATLYNDSSPISPLPILGLTAETLSKLHRHKDTLSVFVLRC